jgi:recombination protein RecR
MRPEYRRELSEALLSIGETVSVCPHCFRYFTKNGENQCSVCGDASRNTELLMVVEKDVDVDAIEKTGVYTGRYFVLGGVITALEKHPEERIRAKEFARAVSARAKNGLKEIIFALSATMDGDETREYLIEKMEPVTKKLGIRLSTLGRGLSTNSEIEYADPATIKNALSNRK